jgi:hypothetical protein
MEQETTKPLSEEKETMKETAEDLVKHAGDYLETLYKSAILRATQKGVNAGANVINGVLAAVFGLLFMLFAFVGVAFLIGDLIESRAGGFLIMAGLFLLILVALIVAKKSIVSGLRNMIIRKIYD